jgi:NO-binding membrane sensor protein with MHYT domain
MDAHGPALSGYYDFRLVTASILVAVLAAYAALDLAGRVTATKGLLRLTWLGGNAVAMGFGIWSMHYIGMEAFRLPVLVQYDWPTVLLSMVAAVFASAVTLFVASRKTMGLTAAVFGSLLMGSGIAAMHYVGMEAMRLPAMCTYSSGLVALSIVLAIVILRSAMAEVCRETTDGNMEQAKAWKRTADGAGHSGDALRRHGRCQLYARLTTCLRTYTRDNHLGYRSEWDCTRSPGSFGTCFPDGIT